MLILTISCFGLVKIDWSIHQNQELVIPENHSKWIPLDLQPKWLVCYMNWQIIATEGKLCRNILSGPCVHKKEVPVWKMGSITMNTQMAIHEERKTKTDLSLTFYSALFPGFPIFQTGLSHQQEPEVCPSHLKRTPKRERERTHNLKSFCYKVTFS